MRIIRRFIEVDNQSIHYREGGQGECLLFIHEMPLSSEVFIPLMNRLKEQMHVVAPDLPGYGDSSPLNERLSISQYASLLLKFMDQANIGYFSIFGVHGGASIAIEMAKQASDRVNKLFLSGVPLFKEEERVKMHQNLKVFTYDDSGNHFQQWWYYFEKKWDETTSKEIIHTAVIDVMKAGPNYDWGYREAFDYNPEPALRELTHPVFLPIAKDDPLVSKNAIILEMLPHAREIMIDVPQHIAQAKPDETAEMILKIIKNN